MNNVASYASRYALNLGLSPSLSGFHKLVQAVIVYVSSPKFPKLEDVCADIGNRESIQLNTVEHSIAYALNAADNIIDKIYEITGVKVQATDIRPKFVICLIAQCIKRDLEELE